VYHTVIPPRLGHDARTDEQTGKHTAPDDQAEAHGNDSNVCGQVAIETPGPTRGVSRRSPWSEAAVARLVDIDCEVEGSGQRDEPDEFGVGSGHE
jgi:hypothetical protein